MIQNAKSNMTRRVVAAGCAAALAGDLVFAVKATAAADEIFEYSEIVTWFVLREPAQFSEGQWKAFQRVMGNNFRPLQSRAPGFFVSSR